MTSLGISLIVGAVVALATLFVGLGLRALFHPRPGANRLPRWQPWWWSSRKVKSLIARIWVNMPRPFKIFLISVGVVMAFLIAQGPRPPTKYCVDWFVWIGLDQKNQRNIGIC